MDTIKIRKWISSLFDETLPEKQQPMIFCVDAQAWIILILSKESDGN